MWAPGWEVAYFSVLERKERKDTSRPHLGAAFTDYFKCHSKHVVKLMILFLLKKKLILLFAVLDF